MARFNAARGFVGGATPLCSTESSAKQVSMPHAALWVVQPPRLHNLLSCGSCFNAARGFVGGAAPCGRGQGYSCCGFNAARGFVGGAASSLAALVPLGGKSPFGKSPKI